MLNAYLQRWSLLHPCALLQRHATVNRPPPEAHHWLVTRSAGIPLLWLASSWPSGAAPHTRYPGATQDRLSLSSYTLNPAAEEEEGVTEGWGTGLMQGPWGEGTK